MSTVSILPRFDMPCAARVLKVCFYHFAFELKGLNKIINRKAKETLFKVVIQNERTGKEAL